MKAIVFHQHGGPEVLKYTDAPDPKINATEVLVRMVAAGVCHSDVSVMNGTIPWPAPSLMGHEGAGIVEAVGSEVTRVKVGDHVVVATVANCGACKWCNIGRPTWCRSSIANRIEPFTVNGEPAGNFAATSSFAEVTLVQEIQAVPIAADVPLTSACLIACGVVTGLGSVFNRANVTPGQTAAVFGAGGVGLSVIQALRIKQASRIIAVDINPEKFTVARELGATDFVNPKEHSKPIQDVIVEMTDGGVDYSFECVGNVDLMRAALECCHKGWGESVIIGVAPAGAEIKTRPFQLVTGRVWRGSAFGGVKGRTELPSYVEKAQKGEIPLDTFITHTMGLEDINKAFDLMHEGKSIRSVVHF